MKEWQVATLESKRMVAEDVCSLVFRLTHWTQHKSGQHYDVRLTAPNGYQAERKYSIASPPDKEGIVELGVQLLAGGEVSPYLYQLEDGQQIEMRGPLGGHFIWDTTMPGPLILLGGGSGMVPLMAMLRHWRNQPDDREIVFLISARSLGHVLYADELKTYTQPNVKIHIALTDEQPDDWTGYARRIDAAMIEETMGSLKAAMPMVYICGPTPFVEAGAQLLVENGFNAHAIRTERFGDAAPKESIAAS